MGAREDALPQIPVPKVMTERSIAFVARKINTAMKRGAKQIDPAVAKHAKKEDK
ncbi:hypothetical protein [Rhizobium mesoamericanum]|uniref:hypothetical protein n=1 Tax=Rhizobium mesoamericanum TaxID=1079800 RepID=UPI000406A474|nr:hypothetical protein [Rhizobium mesoamericanum]